MATYQQFYENRVDGNYLADSPSLPLQSHYYYRDLKCFIDEYGLVGIRCLEIGSGIGRFQDMVDDYWGADVSAGLGVNYHKNYVVHGGNGYPLPSESFEAIWTLFAYEHFPDLQAGMLEIKRLLKPGGLVFFAPAWQCRPWGGQGYAVRPYGSLRWWERFIKASILWRDSLLWRSLNLFPKRLFWHLLFLFGCRPKSIRFSRISPNYEVFWGPDSDACNSIDPHDALLWFLGHGFRCLSHRDFLSAFLVRTGPLICQKEWT